MSFLTTIIFYLMIGASVSFAVLLSDRRNTNIVRLFHVMTAMVFWPLFLPGLMHRDESRPSPLPFEESTFPACPGLSPGSDRPKSLSVTDEMELAICQVEVELDTALRSLDGWAEDVLAPENDRFAELRAAWRCQATRIRELDLLLVQPAFRGENTIVNEDNPSVPAVDDRIRNSQRTRRENVERLRSIRDQMHRDLMGTLAWVRELVTLIHLAKYTGAPASRAEELVGQIAAAVEGLSEVANWQQLSKC